MTTEKNTPQYDEWIKQILKRMKKTSSQKEKYYQEDIYLMGSKTSLETLERLRKNKIEKREQEWELKEKTILLYDEFIKEVSNFLKSLDLQNSIDYTLAISYLIQKGYLSEDLFFDKIETRKELENRWGISIITGAGCCRNLSSIHYDIMKELKIPTKKLYCHVDALFQDGKKKRANHVISLIRYQRTLYGIDLMNGNQLYHFKTPFHLDLISDRDIRQLSYKPYMEIILNESNLETIKTTIKRLKRESQKPWINPIDYRDEIVFPIVKKLEKQKDEMHTFHEKTKVLKKEIAKGMEER